MELGVPEHFQQITATVPLLALKTTVLSGQRFQINTDGFLVPEILIEARKKIERFSKNSIESQNS